MKMDARKLLHDLGGQAEVRRKLETAGKKISMDGVEKWGVRGSIPGEWLMALSGIQKFDLSKYVIKPTAKRKVK